MSDDRVGPDAEGSLAQNAWFVLSSTDEGYLLRDRHTNEPLQRFPGTDEGSDEAWAAYGERTRQVRRDVMWPKWLFRALIAGVILWVIPGTLVSAVYVLTSLDPFKNAQVPVWVSLWLQVIDTLGYRLAVGSAAILVAWFVVRRWRRA